MPAPTCVLRSLRHQLKPGFSQLLLDRFDLGGIAGLKAQLQEAACDGHVCIAAVMVDAHDIGPAARDDVADQTQLAGLVLERDHQVRLAAAHDQTARDDTGEDVYINVAA